jgi:anti-anti-sigma factor
VPPGALLLPLVARPRFAHRLNREQGMSVAMQVPPPTAVAELAVTVFADGAVTVVALRGEADLATLHVIRDALADVIADGQGDVVVDLAQTEFMDTAALRVVLRARETLGGTGRHLTLRSPSRSASRLLAVFGLGHLATPPLSTEGKELQ